MIERYIAENSDEGLRLKKVYISEKDRDLLNAYGCTYIRDINGELLSFCLYDQKKLIDHEPTETEQKQWRLAWLSEQDRKLDEEAKKLKRRFLNIQNQIARVKGELIGSGKGGTGESH